MRVERLLQDFLLERPLTKIEAIELCAVHGDEFTQLIETAGELRDRYKGRIVTFSPKVFLPLTNLCRDFCGYCTFRKAPEESGAKTLTLEEVLQVATQGKKLGCTEVLFSLGDRPEAIYPEMRDFLAKSGYKRTLDYLYDACHVVLEKTGLLPHSNPGLMGREDLRNLKEVNISLGLMLENVSKRLGQPYGPHENAPDKKGVLRLKTIEEAGKLNIPFTTGLLIGIGETWPERVDSLFAIRQLHEKYGHIQEVIIQNFRSKPAIPMQGYPEPSHSEMTKTIALARLILGGKMNIQAPPNLTPDKYELYLEAGINDWGGVSPITPDFINPEAPWPTLAKLNLKTKEAGYILKARLPIYPEFINKAERFVSANLMPYMESLCGKEGFVENGGYYDGVERALRV